MIKLAKIFSATPCDNCPFRKDVEPFLRRQRVVDIFNAALTKGQTFVCHKTLKSKEGRRTCAGFLHVLNKTGDAQAVQIVQLAERLAGVTPAQLRGADLTYNSVQEMIDAHDKER